jgi:hypothetical protein
MVALHKNGIFSLGISCAPPNINDIRQKILLFHGAWDILNITKNSTNENKCCSTCNEAAGLRSRRFPDALNAKIKRETDTKWLPAQVAPAGRAGPEDGAH